MHYGCAKRQAGSTGCKVARLRLRNGSSLDLPEPSGLLQWFRNTEEPWIRLVLAQQDSLEFSYSKPESLRTVLPLTSCPIAGQRPFRSRERALRCETFAFMQPRPRLMSSLVPMLQRLEPFDRIVGVHLRTGYADWTFRNDDSYFQPNLSTPKPPLLQHWSELDQYFRDCRRGHAGPCFNWEHPRKGHAPRHSDAMQCGGARGRRKEPPYALGTPKGFLSALMLCAVRIAQRLSAAGAQAAASERHLRAPGEHRSPEGGLRWGLLILSDAPAVPSLATHLPSLKGRVVSTAGVGQLGHSSFDRACSARSGCALGPDPGGAWTRSLVDFYLAGAADGFVKGLFTSFLFATMRRNLLCCEPGAFVQWMAWYNLSRSHRDFPMKDRAFMAALGTTHEEDGSA